MPIDRKEQELKLIYLILELINESQIIFSTKQKIRELYYKAKKFGIRESYLRKISLANVRPYKVKNSLDYKNEKILQDIHDLKRQNTHWNILHSMFLHLQLNMRLTQNNGHLLPGIYEVVRVKRKRKQLLIDFLK